MKYQKLEHLVRFDGWTLGLAIKEFYPRFYRDLLEFEGKLAPYWNDVGVTMDPNYYFSI